jgi:hypothetical protein
VTFVVLCEAFVCVETYVYKSRKMAGRQYLTDPNSRFFSVDEDEVDDETFLRHSKSGSSGYMLPNHVYQEKNALEDNRLQLLERRKIIEESTIRSSERSISLLRDSEQIGVATAEVYCY